MAAYLDVDRIDSTPASSLGRVAEAQWVLKEGMQECVAGCNAALCVFLKEANDKVFRFLAHVGPPRVLGLAAGVPGNS